MRLGGSFALLVTLSSALVDLEAHAALPTSPMTGTKSEAIVVHDAKLITKEQFAAMPDTAVINTRTGRTTAGALRAKQQANALALQARIETAKNEAARRTEAARLSALTAQKNRLAASNARLRASANTSTGLIPLAPSYSGPPQIQTVPESIEPGSYFPIGGRGFGALPGKIVMKGLPTGDRVLPLDSWKTSSVGVSIPSDIVGVMDQTVRLQVIRKDGTLSAERSIAFKATRDILYFVPTISVKCIDRADSNNCDPRSGFFGVHTENWFWEDTVAGCDEWKIPNLKNGWTVQGFDVTEMSYGTGSVGGVDGPKLGNTSDSWVVCWSVRGDGPFSGYGAGYWGDVTIVGPKGVPYR